METGRLHPRTRANMKWAGNGILTYNDPDFQYEGLPPRRVNTSRATYSTGESGYAADDGDDYPTTPMPPSCRVQYPYGPKEVLAALMKEISISPGSPGSQSGDSETTYRSDSEDEEAPSRIRLPRRRETVDFRTPRESQGPRRHVADHERRHPRHRSLSPPRRRGESPSRGGFQGPATRRAQEQARRQEESQPLLSRTRDGHEGRSRRPREDSKPSEEPDPVWEGFENLSLGLKGPPSEAPRPPVAEKKKSRQHSARPEKPKRTATHAGTSSSSKKSHRHKESRAEEPSREASHAPKQPRRQPTRPAAPRRAASHASPLDTTSRQTQRNFAENLRKIDAESGMKSRVKEHDDVGSLVVEFHQDSCRRRRHRRRHHSVDSRPVTPVKPKKYGLGFLRHFIKNT